MKKILPFIFILLVVLPSVAYAQDFTMVLEEEEEYLAGNIYKLNLTIDNDGPEEWFSISLLGVPSDWAFMSTQSLRVDQGATGTMHLTLAPPKDAKPGFYSYLLSRPNIFRYLKLYHKKCN